MQVIGLCRFSYPAIGGFQVEHDSLEARIAYLYAQARLEERFHLMETVALPCLRAQTDPNFTLVIVIGDSLPEVHIARLRALTADMPQVKIRALPPGPHRQVMKQVLNDARHDPGAPCLQFRHDDDDAVSVDFVERLRQTAQDCQPLIARNQTLAIDFCKGFTARFQPDGIYAAEVHRPYFVAAMGMYVAGGCKQSIMNFAHHKIARFMPSITIPDAPMFVRTLNASNDSRQKGAKEPELTRLTPEQEGAFEARFAITR
ncbi:putative rhamnosyl transferase [Phaeobacter inhibens]|uniref:putative rhamnosyl transferase n=1 Tax=Phaeobacter inhibens TaxID=221822 RepID=UPI000C9A42AD|nr:putative rhamnosyl transferase [Phaeobacter inhibens]AUQ71894.1 Putative rhamnosyl transferase [Phaeobacter inhibens]UWR91983.1 putative rhamnosyl transferase [Phaeobacter inhibens]